MRPHFNSGDSGFSYWEAIVMMSVTAVVVFLTGSLMFTVRGWSDRQAVHTQRISDIILMDAELRTVAKRIQPPFWVNSYDLMQSGSQWVLPYLNSDRESSVIFENTNSKIVILEKGQQIFETHNLQFVNIDILEEDGAHLLRVLLNDTTEIITRLGGAKFP